MRENIVAQRYAEALFSLGAREGKQAEHGECLEELARLLAAEPKLGQVLKSPLVSAEEKKAVLGQILAKLDSDATMRNFCFLLADKNRLAELAAIAGCYRALLDNAMGILRGSVITAIRLDEKRQQDVRRKLKDKVGKDMEVTFHIDPEILGGLVLRVGDKVVDASLRAQLGILRETLIRGM